MSYNTINAFIIDFLNENCDNSVLEQWNECQEVFKKKFTTKKSKSKKDINKPKQASSGYMFFCKEQRAVVHDENPELSNTEVIRELGKRWKALSDKEKYNDLAIEDKNRYKSEMTNYVPSSDDDSDENTPTKRTKKTKDPNAPKSAKNAYILFSIDERIALTKSNSNLKGTAILSEIGSRWKKLKANNDPKVAIYERKAQA